MRLMIIGKPLKEAEAGLMPEEKLIAALATYHEELAKSRRAARCVGTASER